LEKLPSLLEFISFIYFFPQALCGPVVEFYDFQLFMNRNGRYKNIPNGLSTALYHFTIGMVNKSK